MKILFISHFLPYPPQGGSLQRSFNLLREISGSNEIYLLAINQKAILPNDEQINESVTALSTLCKYIRVFKVSSDYSRVRWYLLLFLNLFSSSPYSVWKFRSKELIQEIRKLQGESKFDLIHMDTLDLAQYEKFLGNAHKVMNHHNIESALMIRRCQSEKNPLVRLYFYLQAQKLKQYEKKHVPLFDINLVVSSNDKKLLERNVPRARIHIVPNGTDIGYFRPNNQINLRELVFAGGMNWYPNRDAMIYFCECIYPLIKCSVSDVVINIIGSSPPQKLLNLAEKDNSIKIYGFVEDIRPLLNQSTIYIVPIRVGGGTRLKILDAFACGKALVSTTVGCEGIEVTPDQDILIGDSPEEFAAQVIKLLNDSCLRAKLEINARRLVETKYSWQVIGGVLNKIYESVGR